MTMTKRKATQRPSPLQQRYFRAGLNEGAARTAQTARAALEEALTVFLDRLRFHGVAVEVPLLSDKHPMSVWRRKKHGR